MGDSYNKGIEQSKGDAEDMTAGTLPLERDAFAESILGERRSYPFQAAGLKMICVSSAGAHSPLTNAEWLFPSIIYRRRQSGWNHDAKLRPSSGRSFFDF